MIRRAIGLASRVITRHSSAHVITDAPRPRRRRHLDREAATLRKALLTTAIHAARHRHCTNHPAEPAAVVVTIDGVEVAWCVDCWIHDGTQPLAMTA